MTQGLFIDHRRPKSKKEVRELLESAMPSNYPDDVPSGHDYSQDILSRLRIEGTSMFGNEYDGPLHQMPMRNKVTFVGPDPYTNRKFYGQIFWDKKKGGWVAK